MKYLLTLSLLFHISLPLRAAPEDLVLYKKDGSASMIYLKDDGYIYLRKCKNDSLVKSRRECESDTEYRVIAKSRLIEEFRILSFRRSLDSKIYTLADEAKRVKLDILSGTELYEKQQLLKAKREFVKAPMEKHKLLGTEISTKVAKQLEQIKELEARLKLHFDSLKDAKLKEYEKLIAKSAKDALGMMESKTVVTKASPIKDPIFAEFLKEVLQKDPRTGLDDRDIIFEYPDICGVGYRGVSSLKKLLKSFTLSFSRFHYDCLSNSIKLECSSYHLTEKVSIDNATGADFELLEAKIRSLIETSCGKGHQFISKEKVSDKKVGNNYEIYNMKDELVEKGTVKPE